MQSKLERRVVGAAQSLLDHQHAVAPLDVLGAIGWLPAPMLERWRRGQAGRLADVMQVSPARVTELLTILHRWATARGLEPTEIVYVTSTRDRSTLRFTADGDPAAGTGLRHPLDGAEAVRGRPAAAGRAASQAARSRGALGADYDALLMSGVAGADARDQIRTDIDRVLATWRAP